MPFILRRKGKRVGPSQGQHAATEQFLEGPKMSVHRPVYDQDTFDQEFGMVEFDEEIHLFDKIRAKCMECSWHRSLKCCSSLVPMASWLPSYKWKRWLLADVIAGLTVGIMNIPQGMAYGILVFPLAPVFGLYTSLFPPFFYAIFGTSRHISVGTFAIISLMASSALNKVAPNSGGAPSTGNCSDTTSYSNCTSTSSTSDLSIADEAQMARVAASATLTMLVGFCMILCGILRLGFVATYLSDQLVQGLTTGAAVQVLSSQISQLFGLDKKSIGLPSTSGPLALIKFYIVFFQNIDQTNLITLAISAIALVILLLHREFLSQWFRKKFKIPLPMELLIVVGSTLASYFIKLHELHDVTTVGDIPPGLPTPKMPSFDLASVESLAPDAIVIAVVTFSLSMSMSKIFAKKHNYTIRANQEWLAYGLVNILSALFSCHCAGTSLSRSAVQNDQGGKTQLASMVACLVILLVLLVLAQLFALLPKCILAAIIFVAMKSLLDQAKVLPKLWRQSKLDFLIWIVSCIAVIILDISFGLLVAVIFALLCVIYRSQWPQSRLLGRLRNTNEYKFLSGYSTALEVPNVKIFRFDAPLYFANADYFKHQLYAHTVHPVHALKARQRREKRQAKLAAAIALQEHAVILDSPTSGRITPDFDNDQQAAMVDPQIRYLILDCSSIAYVDVQGMQTLKEVYEEFGKLDIMVLFACCKRDLRAMFLKGEFYNMVPKWSLFVSIHDAVLTLEAMEQEKLDELPASLPPHDIMTDIDGHDVAQIQMERL